MECKHCGADLEDEAKYCAECGEPTETSVSATNKQRTKDTNVDVKRFDKWIANCLVVLLIAGVGGLAFWKGADSSGWLENFESKSIAQASSDTGDKSAETELTVKAFPISEQATEADSTICIIAPEDRQDFYGFSLVAEGIGEREGTRESCFVKLPASDTESACTLSVPQGRYRIKVDGFVMGLDGYLYKDKDPYGEVIDTDEPSASSCLISTSFLPIAPSLVTDEMLDNITTSWEEAGAEEYVYQPAEFVRTRRALAASHEMSHREQLALDFVETYYDRNVARGADADGHANISPCDIDAWHNACTSFLAEDTPLHDYFSTHYEDLPEGLRADLDVGSYWGSEPFEAYSIFKDAGIVRSDGDTVIVSVQNWEGNGSLPADFEDTVEPYAQCLAITFNESDQIVALRLYEQYDRTTRQKDAYRSFAEKVAAYEKAHGLCAETEGKVGGNDCHGVTGLVLAQLIDFDKDGQDELMLVYHDAGHTNEYNNLSSETYKIEVWTYADGSLKKIVGTTADSSKLGSARILLQEGDEGYAMVSHEEANDAIVHLYRLSTVDNDAMGEHYWDDMAERSYYLREYRIMTIRTEEILGMRGKGGS